MIKKRKKNNEKKKKEEREAETFSFACKRKAHIRIAGGNAVGKGGRPLLKPPKNRTIKNNRFLAKLLFFSLRFLISAKENQRKLHYNRNNKKSNDKKKNKT